MAFDLGFAVETTMGKSPWPTDDDLVHISCCVNERVGLCGQGLTGDSDEGPNCIVCRDLEDRNDDGCPVFGRCRY